MFQKIKTLTKLFFIINKKISLLSIIKFIHFGVNLKHSGLFILDKEKDLYLFNYNNKKGETLVSFLLKSNEIISKQYRSIFPLEKDFGFVANQTILLDTEGKEVYDFSKDNVEILVHVNYLDKYIMGENWKENRRFLFDKNTFELLNENQITNNYFHFYVMDNTQPICMYVKDLSTKRSELIYENTEDPKKQVWGDDIEELWNKIKAKDFKNLFFSCEQVKHFFY